MAKFDAVDRLMQQATEKVGSSKQANRDGEREKASGRTPEQPPLTAAPSSPQAGGERGQQLAGVLQSLGPIFGTVLRRVNHPAAKAAAELLPIAGSVGARLWESGRAASAAKYPSPAESQLRATLDQQQSAAHGEMKALRDRLEVQDDQLRRMRESLERTVAEQGALTHKISQGSARLRLLGIGVVILLLLSITQAVLLAIVLHR